MPLGLFSQLPRFGRGITTHLYEAPALNVPVTAWFDAQVSETLTLVDGGVSAWGAIVGGQVATQSTGTLRPNLGELNGKQVIECQPGDYLSVPASIFPLGSGDFDMYVVCGRVGHGGPGWRLILGGGGLRLYYDNGYHSLHFVMENSSAGGAAQVALQGAMYHQDIPNGGMSFINVRYASGSTLDMHTLYKQIVSASVEVPSKNLVVSSPTFGNGVDPLKIGEYVLFDGVLGGQERSDFLIYLKNKWGMV